MATASVEIAAPGLQQAESQIHAEFPAATNFRWREIARGFLNSSIYHVEYSLPDNNDEPNTFYYVQIDEKGEARLFDDGLDLVEGLQAALEKRRSFVQRLGEFTFFDFITALIAVAVTGTFVYLVIAVPEQGREFGSVFGIVAATTLERTSRRGRLIASGRAYANHWSR